MIVMARAQKEIRMHGFYMVIANMETFSLVKWLKWKGAIEIHCISFYFQLVNLIASAFTLLKSTVGE